jgi:S-DNA-T family DNA segregation ATPase FtsK/SpoIIIE
VFATIAPVIVALGMWAVTRSPFALMFAAFGPVMAISGYVDAGVGGRRRHRRAVRSHARAIATVGDEIDRRHAEERRRRDAAHPAASLIVSSGRTDARWRVPASVSTLVTVGRGAAASALSIDGPEDPGTAAIRARAATISDVPIVVDAAHGIGIVGPLAVARSVARSLVVQLAHATSPDRLTVRLPHAGWSDLGALPHVRDRWGEPPSSGAGTRTLTIVERSDGDEPGSPTHLVSDGVTPMLIVVAGSVDELPATCTEILECTAATRGLWRRAGSVDEVALSTDMVSRPEASAFADAMAEDARMLGLASEKNEPPVTLRFDELPTTPVRAAHSLAAPIGATASGPLVVDLVADGPHAVVGGTTGSGKSELLITWATALAHASTPEELSLLLFDFKGGATFAVLAPLPHVVGLVTDLDEAAASRALSSLRAELRYRERVLQESGVRDVRDAAPGLLARLVIMVDEFAALIDTFPELHAVFVDIAARGRSLGVHLVLCTQRPAVAVRDGVLANCDVRISLRVNNASDSLSVIGVPDAAALPSAVPGRVLAALGGRPAELAQVATTSPQHIEAARARGTGRSSRRPWLDPLPPRIALEELTEPSLEEPRLPDGVGNPTGSLGGGGRFVLGRLDLPGEQRQPVAVYEPVSDGHLLVLGTAGRGSSSLLRLLAAQDVEGWNVIAVPADPEAAWDDLVELAERVRTASPGSGSRTLVLIDDIDLLFARWGDEYARAARADLSEVLRSGAAAGVYVVVTAHRATADVLALAGLVGSTLRLGSANKQEHVLSGGESATYRADRRAGSGVWRGAELQLATSGSTTRVPAHRPAVGSVTIGPGVLMIVSRRTTLRARWARHQGADSVVVLGAPGLGTLRIDELSDGRRSTVVVGDADGWQQQWALLGALRTSATVVVEDSTVSEFRALTRRGELPPWTAPGAARAWVVHPGGRVTRATFEEVSGEPRRGSESRTRRRPLDVARRE